MQSILNKSFIKNIFKSPTWLKGHKPFYHLLNKPLIFSWAKVDDLDLTSHTRKSNCPFFAESLENQKKCIAYLQKKTLSASSHDRIIAFECHQGKKCRSLSVKKKGKQLGGVFLCNLSDGLRSSKAIEESFLSFLDSQVEIEDKKQQIESIYQELHPRALAMSTMHTIHRIISSSLDINDLLPRIARFTQQVLNADYCAIFLLNRTKRLLVKRFEVGKLVATSPLYKKTSIRVKSGVLGNIVNTGEFYFKKKLLAVPLIEDDVIGVIVVANIKNEFQNVDLEILKTVSEQTVIAIKNAQLFENTEKITSDSIDAIVSMMEKNIKPTKTARPDSLLTYIVSELCKELSVTKDEKKYLYYAVKLIEAGIVNVPGHIVNKRSPLSEYEKEIIKKLPIKGVELIKEVDFLKPVVPIIFYQNERYEGTGYPHRLKGVEIPFCARVITLAMSFSAMTSARAYREPKNFYEALSEIRELSGTQFDPRVVDAFFRIVSRQSQKKRILEIIAKGG